MAFSLHPSWLSSSLSSTALFPPTSTIQPRNSCFKLSFSLTQKNGEASKPISPDSESQVTLSESTQAPLDAVKRAFEKARKYKKSIESNSNSEKDENPDGNSDPDAGNIGERKEIPDSVKIAMKKVREYKNNKGAIGTGVQNRQNAEIGLSRENEGNLTNKVVEQRGRKKESLAISSLDFVGLDFADKKRSRGLPLGLVPLADPFPEGELPEVEIIVGDTSKFGEATTLEPKTIREDDSDLYKPKVSTWGVFPRPNDISKTFGGGRTIRPGDALETEEDRAAKEKHTRELLAAYKKKVGLSVDPKLKSDCEKALKDGDSLMSSGKLKEALPCYEKVMEQMVFQSELHGLAALQWSICQDSLSRPNEARMMYERLQSHPNAKVSKKARQFMFSFKAMEMMKVTGSNPFLKNTGYQDYFEAFIEDKSNYPTEADEVNNDELSQALLYLFFLASPIFMVLCIAIKKGM